MGEWLIIVPSLEIGKLTLLVAPGWKVGLLAHSSLINFLFYSSHCCALMLQNLVELYSLLTLTRKQIAFKNN